MNLNPYICEQLGIEMEEEFTIKNSNGTYKFTEKGLVVKYPNTKGWMEATGTLYSLVNGRSVIDKE